MKYYPLGYNFHSERFAPNNRLLFLVMTDISSWDSSSVVARAKALIHASNYEKVNEARQEVDDTLARWVAAVGALSDPMSAARGSTAVVALWRQYAALEMELRQFKQATKVFERAVSCPVAGTSTALWLQYTDFCVQRKKYSNARKIFDKQEVVIPGVIEPAKATVAEPTSYFSHIPETLPFIPTCPHLVFDSVGDGEAQKQIDNELLERLSDVLGDSAVFAGVRDLRDNQRTRDREMLYRWQDLVSMQMKEGSELFARHVALEMQHGFSDPRGLIAVKTQHLEQRREFSSRCQMSQQQFIEICAMDRANALKAQQISLENMKIPEMTVTTESEAISLQVH
ncbi:hypothetical protein JM18_007475 [Phytophthora kernoviae]|uniref:Suppressor of forked domain-containing protein n=2 Tax=Phytophthora kernoviae TaxID=325452 RepID=A0A8T0LRH8_9STRA|nr:hypothetical protein G195_008949 [Phytophthora kernoviae 00238/432]KAG2517176.1 hypothetical protein JM16_007503 [Phytophthora kernoviae]KAG2519684.1 hypothetical protein JM18_007475 [Phytophthora kernoviae]